MENRLRGDAPGHRELCLGGKVRDGWEAIQPAGVSIRQPLLTPELGSGRKA